MQSGCESELRTSATAMPTSFTCKLHTVSQCSASFITTNIQDHNFRNITSQTAVILLLLPPITRTRHKSNCSHPIIAPTYYLHSSQVKLQSSYYCSHLLLALITSQTAVILLLLPLITRTHHKSNCSHPIIATTYYSHSLYKCQWNLPHHLILSGFQFAFFKH